MWEREYQSWRDHVDQCNAYIGHTWQRPNAGVQINVDVDDVDVVDGARTREEEAVVHQDPDPEESISQELLAIGPPSPQIRRVAQATAAPPVEPVEEAPIDGPDYWANWSEFRVYAGQAGHTVEDPQARATERSAVKGRGKGWRWFMKGKGAGKKGQGKGKVSGED